MNNPINERDLAASEQIKRANEIHNKQDATRANICPVQAILFICPTEGCGNYYAAQTFVPSNPTLYQVQRRRAQKGGDETTHTRVECPDCRANGILVDRIPYIVTEVVPYVESI